MGIFCSISNLSVDWLVDMSITDAPIWFGSVAAGVTVGTADEDDDDDDSGFILIAYVVSTISGNDLTVSPFFCLLKREKFGKNSNC